MKKILLLCLAVISAVAYPEQSKADSQRQRATDESIPPVTWKGTGPALGKKDGFVVGGVLDNQLQRTICEGRENEGCEAHSFDCGFRSFKTGVVLATPMSHRIFDITLYAPFYDIQDAENEFQTLVRSLGKLYGHEFKISSDEKSPLRQAICVIPVHKDILFINIVYPKNPPKGQDYGMMLIYRSKNYEKICEYELRKKIKPWLSNLLEHDL